MTRSTDDATLERRVLIVNSSQDIVDMLRFTFESAAGRRLRLTSTMRRKAPWTLVRRFLQTIREV